MSAYCLTADVENLMSTRFTSTSKPATAEVTAAIASISADIDGVLAAAGYTIPVTNADALALLRQYATMGVSARAWHTSYAVNDEPPRVSYWRTQYDAFLSRIRNGTQVLPGGLGSSVSQTSISDETWRADSLVSRRPGEWTRRTYFDH